MDTIVQLDTVDQYNRLYGLETRHPLVSVVDLTHATNVVNDIRMSYGVYALFLKGGRDCELKYGRNTYDYQEGTVVCFAPGQVVEVSHVVDEVKPRVYGILFHPDLLRGTSLGRSISKYSFFSYSSYEALHLSARERRLFCDCMSNIEQELDHSIDRHSKQLISIHLELLLNYCVRFYERQFVTRQEVNLDVLQKFESALDGYFSEGLARDLGLPTVKYFADKVFLSPNYFGDLIKKETGKTPQEFIHLKLMDIAKGRILDTNLSMSEIAYELGFQYPQHFVRLFKKRMHVTPNMYRREHV